MTVIAGELAPGRLTSLVVMVTIAAILLLSLALIASERPPGMQPAAAEATVRAPDAACIASRQRRGPLGEDSDPARARAVFVLATRGCMMTTHAAMMGALEAQPSADAVFAAAMVPHHQGAIDMARQLLVHGNDPELRALALGVIAEQQAEIEVLRAWSARHP